MILNSVSEDFPRLFWKCKIGFQYTINLEIPPLNVCIQAKKNLSVKRNMLKSEPQSLVIDEIGWFIGFMS